MTRVPSSQHPLLAREGLSPALIAAASAVGLYTTLGTGPAVVAVIGCMALLYLCRDPHRDSPSLPLALVAPVDGRVLSARQGTDPWLGRDDAVVVVTQNGLLDVHSIFSPIEGKIVEQWSAPKHPTQDARRRHAIAYQLRTDEGDDVVLELARGPLSGPVNIHYQPGERVGHGRRIGYAMLGCRATVYAAPGSRLDTERDVDIDAAATVVATLVHDEPVSAVAAPSDV